MAGLTTKDKEALKLFKEKLLQEFADQIDSIQLFGSKARGEAQKHSDVDVLVILDGGVPQDRHRVNRLTSDIMLETGVLVSPKTFTKSQWQEMERDQDMFWQVVQPDLQEV